MALKIKEGAVINPYGREAFTSESNLTQDVLGYLKQQYPDDIIEVKDEKKSTKKDDT
jgi:hypothetical protein